MLIYISFQLQWTGPACFAAVLYRLRHDRMKVIALLGCQRQSTKSWDCWVVCRICLAKVSGQFLSLSGGDCVNSAFWSQSVIERLLVWRTAEGLKRDQSPLSGLSGRFTCGWVQAARWWEQWRTKAWKVFLTWLVYEPSWWFSDRVNVAWHSLSLKGLFIFCSFNKRSLASICVGFAEVYAINILHSMEK